MAGRLSIWLENKGDAGAWCSIARELATEAGHKTKLAFALTISRRQHSPGLSRSGGDVRKALALLDEAASHLKPDSPPTATEAPVP